MGAAEGAYGRDSDEYISSMRSYVGALREVDRHDEAEKANRELLEIM